MDITIYRFAFHYMQQMSYHASDSIFIVSQFLFFLFIFLLQVNAEDIFIDCIVTKIFDTTQLEILNHK